MPAEDRTKYLKAAGIVFVLALIILLGTLMSQCRMGSSPQEQETSPQSNEDDVTHVVPVEPSVDGQNHPYLRMTA